MNSRIFLRQPEGPTRLFCRYQLTIGSSVYRSRSAAIGNSYPRYQPCRRGPDGYEAIKEGRGTEHEMKYNIGNLFQLGIFLVIRQFSSRWTGKSSFLPSDGRHICSEPDAIASGSNNGKVVARTGLEPATSALKGRHPNH